MIINLLKNYNIIQKGDFTLSSGKKSNVYIDLRKVISYPNLHNLICCELFYSMKKNYNHICGTPYGAISYASIISVTNNIPMLFLRKEQKQYGTKNLIEGVYNEKDKVVLIEDVITSGNSVIQTAKKLEENGLEVVQIISVISRCENKNLKYNDIPIQYLYHIDEIIDK